MKRIILRISTLICLVAALLISASACWQANSPANAKPTILDHFMTKEGFTFEHCEWYITKSDFYKKSNLNDEDFSIHNDYLFSNNKVTFETPNAAATLIYNFSGNKLVAGQYLIGFSDEEEETFLSCCRELKSVLDEGLGKPHAGATSELVHWQPGSDNNVAWMGEDGSGLSITVFGQSNKRNGNGYYINIQVIAPPST